jgi:hypothetical protein
MRRKIEGFAQKRQDGAELLWRSNKRYVRNSTTALSALNKTLAPDFALEMNHNAQRIDPYRQIREYARRAKEGVAIARHDFHVAEASYRRLELSIQFGERRRPVLQ